MLGIYTATAHENAVESLGEETWNSTAGKGVRDWMINNELCTPLYRPTEKLEAMVNHLCDQPLPVKKWVQPEQAYD